MSRPFTTWVMAVVTAMVLGASAAYGQEEAVTESFITAAEWQAYTEAFVTDQGRVIDTINRDVSHSESQGYGMLLAYLAQDRAAFERIWSFTQTELMIRDDGLAAWLWDPEAEPAITDVNNATDGDILIAYALALAGADWGDAAKLQQAGAIARAIAADMLVDAHDIVAILPGAAGFSAADRPDGPVVNPSYWVFEAFPVLAELTPDIDWMRVHDDGLTLIERTATDGRLPPDWISLAGEQPVPAEGFAPEFGYNNVRIPLYLIRDERVDADLLERFSTLFDQDDAPGRIDTTTGERLETMGEAGYRLIGAAHGCVTDGDPVPAELQVFQPTSYYGATLQLLMLEHLRHRHTDCLAADSPAAEMPVEGS